MSFGGLTRGPWAAMPFRTKDKKTKMEQELLHWSVWGQIASDDGKWQRPCKQIYDSLMKKRELNTEHFHSHLSRLILNQGYPVHIGKTLSVPFYLIGHLTYSLLKNRGAPHAS